MGTNDRILLDEILTQKRSEVAPDVSESEFLELFSAEQLLKDYDLSYEELESGLIGAGGDGGIDGIYLFINGDLATEDFDYSSLRRNIEIRLVIIQVKTSAGFGETPVERLLTVTQDILDLSKDLESLVETYNAQLLEAIGLFRRAQAELAPRFPRLKIDYYYASKGDEVHPNVERKADKVKDIVLEHFPQCRPSFSFVGASRLLELARRQPQTVFSLQLAENPISSSGRDAFVCLVRLGDFFSFIADEKGSLRRPMFEANVRDYQGKTEVNDEIRGTLSSQSESEDFWWLNNGVTVLATRASQSGKALTIEDPQIVNGLQTSTEVYNYYRNRGDAEDLRTILVRVVVPAEPESRDRIIKATNRQTSVQAASLRATDKVQRDIEQYLRPRGLFYDRRKNFYKNEGRPRDKIVGIPYLGQGVMSIVLQRPDTARARPSSLLKRDDDYKEVFSSKHPIQIYHLCAAVMRRVEHVLRSQEPPIGGSERNNLKFYVAMQAVALCIGKPTPSIDELSQLDPAEVTDERIVEALMLVTRRYEELGGDDQVAKGSSLLTALLEV